MERHRIYESKWRHTFTGNASSNFVKYGSMDDDMIRKNSRKGFGSTTFQDDETKWMKLAKCVGYDVNMFFPDGVDDHRKADAIPDELESICGQCRVTAECLAFALKHEMIGVWGGSNDYTRTQLKKNNTKIVCPGCRSDNIIKEFDGSTICCSCGLSWT